MKQNEALVYMDINEHGTDEARGSLVHVEIALEDTLLHSVGHLGLLRHLANGRLHDGHALSTLMRWRLGLHRLDARHGRALGSGTEVLCKTVAFA